MEGITTSTVFWPDPKKGPWNVTFHWLNVEDSARLVGVDVHSFDDQATSKRRPVPEELTATVLRALPLKQLALQSYKKIAGQWISYLVGHRQEKPTSIGQPVPEEPRNPGPEAGPPTGGRGDGAATPRPATGRGAGPGPAPETGAAAVAGPGRRGGR